MLEAIPERIRLSIEMPEGEQGCWIWTGARTSGGYGAVSVGGKPVRVHRYVYEVLKGRLASGVDLHHDKCERRLCCNPAHLKEVTSPQHAAIHRIWDRDRGADGNRKWCPKRKHELAVVGVHIDAKGHRKCRACLSEKWRRKNARVRGKKTRRPAGVEVELIL